MKSFQYKNMITGEIVIDEEAEEYVKENLGIPGLIPKGKFGTLSQEQTEFISEFTEWYFSGKWIKEEVKNELDG